jgi:hypothetical protein
VHETERDYERLAARFWNLPQKGEEEADASSFLWTTSSRRLTLTARWNG